MRSIGLGLIASALDWIRLDTLGSQEQGFGWWGGGHPMGWIWGIWGIGMFLMMLVFWGLVIGGIVLGIRWLVGRDKGSPPDSALEILRQRYARGEIDREEFEQKKKDLR
jgi:putative membrane protein